LTKAKAGATGTGLAQSITAYISAKKNPNPSSGPSSNGSNAPSGWNFVKMEPAVNYRIYQSQGTLSGSTYSWAAATSDSSTVVFTFRDDDVIDGGPDHAGAEYEVNENDIWIDTDADDRKYIAQANFSDAISDSEWKEAPPDGGPIFDDPTTLPDVGLYPLGTIILVGEQFYIALDF